MIVWLIQYRRRSVEMGGGGGLKGFSGIFSEVGVDPKQSDCIFGYFFL